MCGIAGFYNFENKTELANKANVFQKHRGPDNQSVWEDDNISLAHQRLSIIDLKERSDQPFIKNGLVLVYNGELYNFKEIRNELIKEFKTDFITDSDTEVILEAYYNYGVSCFNKFIGMFAFAIYDSRNKSTLLVRDHFGIKPLFYFTKKDKLAFASEMKTLVELIDDKHADLNREAVVKCVNYSWVPGNMTMFNSINKLPPGTFAIYEGGKLTIKSYHKIETEIINNKTVDDYRDVLLKSIERHMISDVPVTSFLSGGLDSSLITVIANKILNGIDTYTIATDSKDKKIEQMPDDQKYARKLADLHGFNHHEIPLKADIIDLLPKIIYHLDEPIGDPAAINTYLICRAMNAEKKKSNFIRNGC